MNQQMKTHLWIYVMVIKRMLDTDEQDAKPEEIWETRKPIPYSAKVSEAKL
jgi:hypothetical protein